LFSPQKKLASPPSAIWRGAVPVAVSPTFPTGTFCLPPSASGTVSRLSSISPVPPFFSKAAFGVGSFRHPSTMIFGLLLGFFFFNFSAPFFLCCRTGTFCRLFPHFDFLSPGFTPPVSHDPSNLFFFHDKVFFFLAFRRWTCALFLSLRYSAPCFPFNLLTLESLWGRFPVFSPWSAPALKTPSPSFFFT